MFIAVARYVTLLAVLSELYHLQDDAMETESLPLTPEPGQSHTFLRKIQRALLEHDSLSINSDRGPKTLAPVPSSIIKQNKLTSGNLVTLARRRSESSSDSIPTSFDRSQPAPMPQYETFTSSNTITSRDTGALDKSPSTSEESSVSSSDHLIIRSPLQADYFLKKYYQQRVSELEGLPIHFSPPSPLIFVSMI